MTCQQFRPDPAMTASAGCVAAPDLVKSLDWRAITRELLYRPVDPHLLGNLARDPNRTASHIWPAAGNVERIHRDFHLDVIVREIGCVAAPNS